MARMEPYVYKVVSVVKITDGDTYWLRLDVGFRQEILVDLRLLGYDCPEMNRGSLFEKAQAKKAKALAEDFFRADGIMVRTEKDPDSFGRWLGEVRNTTTGELLGEVLRSEGLASVWPTRWAEEFDQKV